MRSLCGSEYRIAYIVIMIVKLTINFVFKFIIGPFYKILLNQLWFIILYDKIRHKKKTQCPHCNKCMRKDSIFRHRKVCANIIQ